MKVTANSDKGGKIMVPINRISKINHPGVFNGFSWPSELYEFGRYNVIYGWNGTGKTTLSKLVRALELGKYEEGTSASFKVNDNEVTDVSNMPQNMKIKVFNKDFISESVFPTDGKDMRLILVMGKENVKNQKLLNSVKSEVSVASDKQERARKDERNLLQALDKHCISAAKTIKDVLRSPGDNFYNNYDKSNYKKRAEELLNYEKNGTGFLSDSDYYSFLAKTRSKPKLRIAELSLEFSPLSDIFEKAKRILEQSVIRKTIEEISNDDSLSNWLFEGLLLHDERESEKCLFCSQTLPKRE
jgi:wobble nucleotide-excising tRNase